MTDALISSIAAFRSTVVQVRSGPSQHMNLMPPHQNQQAAVALDISPHGVEVLVAEEMNQMTCQEREQIYEEIHGVVQEVDEASNDDFCAERLEAFRTALLLSSTAKDRPYIHKAMQVEPTYLHDPHLQLMFLRAESFDAQQAVLRLERYLAGKVHYFGEQTLTRTVCLSDLSDEDLHVLQSGCLQLLPARDRAGRAVVANVTLDDSLEVNDIKNLIRSAIYLALSVSEEEETQRNGVVLLSHFPANLGLMKRVYGHIVQDGTSSFMSWIPLRLACGHFCGDTPASVQTIHALGMMIATKSQRLRCRCHNASQLECQYALMTFGIPMDVFPMTYDGEVKLVAHKRWLARRSIKENALLNGQPFDGVDLPGTQDVLLGRGRTVQDHAGNTVMREFMIQFLGDFQHGSRADKLGLAATVVEEIHRKGGRFLQRRNDGWWSQVDDDVAQTKVLASFRTSLTAAKKAHAAAASEGTAWKSSSDRADSEASWSATLASGKASKLTVDEC